jgi:HSP20 family protein
MKFFADDYFKDIRGMEMKMVRRSLYRYELLHIQRNFGWRPSLDIYETEDDLILLVEMSGIKPEDVEINLGKDRVQLRGNRCRPAEHEVLRVHHMEIDFGPYHQIIALPERVDPKGASSTYSDGFLLIRLPKEVESSSSGS